MKPSVITVIIITKELKNYSSVISSALSNPERMKIAKVCFKLSGFSMIYFKMKKNIEVIKIKKARGIRIFTISTIIFITFVKISITERKSRNLIKLLKRQIVTREYSPSVSADWLNYRTKCCKREIDITIISRTFSKVKYLVLLIIMKQITS